VHAGVVAVVVICDPDGLSRKFALPSCQPDVASTCQVLALELRQAIDDLLTDLPRNA